MKVFLLFLILFSFSDCFAALVVTSSINVIVVVLIEMCYSLSSSPPQLSVSPPAHGASLPFPSSASSGSSTLAIEAGPYFAVG